MLELFTSQGCASCPPADALFAEYAARNGVIALTLPVDYWNYLGWADTLAQHEFTERQRAYATARGDGEIYTPQIVVNGIRHVVGSDRAAIENAIAAAALQPEVGIEIKVTGSAVHVEVGAAAPSAPTWGTIWFVLFDRAETVEIARGENAGRIVTYSNVVVRMHRLTMWRGEAISLEIPLAEMVEAKADGCVVFIQQERSGLPGRIIGAASLLHAY